MTAKGLASRQIAHSLLMRVFKQKQTLEQAMSAEARALNALSGSDRGWVFHLAMAVLRHHGACAALLERYLEQPLKDSRRDITLCLYLGICQLCVLKSPAHAAVDTSVELAKTLHAPLSGLVNAVLKKIARENPPLAALPTHWMWEEWREAYGEETAAAIAVAHLVEPPLDITVKDATQLEHWREVLSYHSSSRNPVFSASNASVQKTEISGAGAQRRQPQAIQQPSSGSQIAPLVIHVEGVDSRASGMTANKVEILPTGSLRLHDASDVITLPGFEEGAWWVQELAASLPVKLMGDLRSKKVLDICAAPGGKTMQLIAAGAEVTALDISGKRLEKLHENLARMQMQAELIEADVMKWEAPGRYDAILLDAPCTATGTLRRHPEIALLRSPQDKDRLVQVQAKMLRRALEWLNPGGVLTYAVCSLQPEEGEEQIAALLAEGRAKLHPIANAPAEWISPQGYLRTLPSYLPESGGMDGFFVAQLTCESV